MKLTSKSTQNNFYALTTGDSNGIGLEVAAKALAQLHGSNLALLKGKSFFIFIRSSEFLTTHEKKTTAKCLAMLKSIFQLSFIDEQILETLAKGRNISAQQKSVFLRASADHSKNTLFVVSCTSPPPMWVVLAARLCLNHFFSALVTGPLSKPLIKQAGLGQIGHTEILKSVCEKRTRNKHFPFMAFLGSEFNVALATGHIPLQKVSKKLNLHLVSQLFKELKSFARHLGDSRPIGILGLNPHAGDQGIIGQEEARWINQFCLMATGRMPLVPDAAFLPQQRKHFSFLLCLYHDQGLIPFKAIHGTHGAHVTLGLPLIRTSVDHGTAFDLFGKNKADSSSMELAIKSAITRKMKA